MHHQLEQQWSDEVRYLHSLWHQGPPPSSSSFAPNPNPNPKLIPVPISTINSTSFKKEKKKKKTKIKKTENSTTPSVPYLEWPCEPVRNPQTETGWPEPKPESTPPVSIQAQEKFNAIQLQRNSLRACQEFFSTNLDGSDSDSDDDDDDDSMEEEEEDGGEAAESGETEEFEFFLRVFKEDEELRKYYEKNFENGEFCCLVCGGIGEKVGKRFKDCVGLVQHSVAISKTKRRNAHRAFGQAICRVLGWNIKRLPSIVLSLEEPLGRSLVHPDNDQGNKEDALTIIVDENTNDKVSDIDNVVAHKGNQANCEVDLVKEDASLQNDIWDKEISEIPGIGSIVEIDNVLGLDKALADDLYGDLGTIEELQQM